MAGRWLATRLSTWLRSFWQVFAVRSPDDPNKVVGIKVMSGARPFDFFKAEIDKVLETAK